MTIRPAISADAPAVTAIAEAAYARYIPAIGRKPAPMVADFAGLIAQGLVFVTGAPDGFIVFFPKDGAMFLENVAVHPVAAGRGLGRALIAFCEAEARRLGLPAITLYTNEKMLANQNLYPRLGYTETHRVSEQGFSRIYYRKAIQQGNGRP